MTGVRVRRLGEPDWAAARAIRLAALRDAPEAYASTEEREHAFPDEEWRRRMRDNVVLHAEADGRAVGTAALYDDGRRPGTVELVGMWVEPAARGSGAADALVTAALDAAAAAGWSAVELWVTRGNDRAERVYARHGFVRTGDTQALPHDPCRDEVRMRRVLGAVRQPV